MNDDVQSASKNIMKRRVRFRRIKKDALITMTIIQFDRFNVKSK
jgi:hypothetical protein